MNEHLLHGAIVRQSLDDLLHNSVLTGVIYSPVKYARLKHAEDSLLYFTESALFQNLHLNFNYLIRVYLKERQTDALSVIKQIDNTISRLKYNVPVSGLNGRIKDNALQIEYIKKALKSRNLKKHERIELLSDLNELRKIQTALNNESCYYTGKDSYLKKLKEILKGV